ncbi:TPR repeat region-containing protein [Nocardiopsis protaetiae]|uniref:TPR repeat region-containing protein n=1 Tax=Nocardiopsis protaetiae TaxID=3382270 RepID=UPI00387ACDF6
MASFDLSLTLRTTDAIPALVRARTTDFEELDARVLGDSEDLQSTLDGAAGQFTSILAWDISGLAAEDRQLWVDAAVALTYAAKVSDMWADHVEEFRDGREELVEEWNTAVTNCEGRVPAKYASSHITATYPEGGWFWTDEDTCRDLYDELVAKRTSIQGRFDTLWNTYQEHAEEIGDMLEQGATKVNVQRLIDGGYANWAFYNLDPGTYTMLVDQRDLTEENAREWSTELAAYWSGDKPLDDRYDELMLMIAMIGTNAKQAQNTGSGFRSEEIDFLEAFYTNLELEGGGHYTGVLSVPQWMDGDHMSGEERAHALGVLGDGLLTLSDEDLGGGYELLPQSVRRAAEGPFLYSTGEDEMPYHLVTYQEDARALSQLLRYTDDELQGGDAFSTNLTLGAGAYMHYWGVEGENGWVVSEELAPLVEVGTRNEDANHYVLTGEYPGGRESIPGLPELAPHERTNAVEGLLTYDWHDDGATARGLIDWVAEDALSEDAAVRDRAGTAAAGFVELVTTADMQEALTDTGVDVGDSKDASFTEFNPELADAFAGVFDSYIVSFAESAIEDGGDNDALITGVGDYNPKTGAFNIGIQERAAYMQYLMGDEAAATRVINSAAAYEYAATEFYIATGDTELAARGPATLHSLIELGISMELDDRVGDDKTAQERREELYGFALGEAGNLAEKIPVMGAFINKGLDLGSDAIVEHLAASDVEITPNVPSHGNESEEARRVNQQVEFLAHILTSGNEAVVQGPGPERLRELEEYGIVSYREDGSIRVETDRGKWNVTNEPGGGADEAANALHAALNGTRIDPSNREQTNGNTMYNEFATPYNTRYDLVQEEGRRGGEDD